MSVSSCIELKKGPAIRPKDHDPYGDTYPYVCERLEKLAKKLRVQSPLRFEYEDPKFYAEIFGDDVPREINRRLKQQEDWYDARAGLRTFAALLQHFQTHGGKAIRDPAKLRAVLYDLEAFQLILQEAAKREDRFRIRVLV